jgi:hypothetical protein
MNFVAASLLQALLALMGLALAQRPQLCAASVRISKRMPESSRGQDASWSRRVLRAWRVQR